MTILMAILIGIWMGVLMGILMGILMMVAMGWPYDSSDCLLCRYNICCARNYPCCLLFLDALVSLVLIKCHLKRIVTQNGILLKMECHQNCNVTQNRMSLKMECYTK